MKCKLGNSKCKHIFKIKFANPLFFEHFWIILPVNSYSSPLLINTITIQKKLGRCVKCK